jgi:hypothetical protein
VGAVLAREDAPPTGCDRLEWLLLTTCPWGIGVVHRVLKSGCRIEAKQLATGDRLRRCLALYSVVAWRILYATLLARGLPDAPCTALLEPDEWQALYRITHATRAPRRGALDRPPRRVPRPRT